MTDQNLEFEAPKAKAKENTIHVRVSEQLFKRVYATAVNSGYTMTDVVIACLEQSLGSVDVGLMKARKKP
jgi:predicted DNA binding CopG/RHH family protein